MPLTTLPPVRRVVTGINQQQRSCIEQDGVSPATLTMPAHPGFRNSNLWRTLASPAPVPAADTITEHRGVLPPAGGTVLRVIDIPPEEKDPELRRQQMTSIFAALFPDARHDAAHMRHPGMHVTDTIDYAIVLYGELVAILDEDETVLRAGDVLIQRGTRHAWANRSNDIARIAFILIDGRR